MRDLVVITDFDYPDDSIERDIIEGAGFALKSFHALSEEAIAEVTQDAVAVLVQYGKVGKTVIDSAPRLKHIARYGVGVDIVDVDYATSRGIQVTNVPADYCLNEVADHAMALLLSINRQLGAYDSATRSGEWKWQSGSPIHRLAETTVGIIGLGRIGQAIAQRLSPFGPTIIASDPYASADTFEKLGIEQLSLSDLLARSDYVIVQTPLTPETQGMLGRDQFAAMKPGAVLINTARGPLVDTDALDEALKSGHLRAAGLDDLPEEPAKQLHWEPRDRLLTNPNTIITPHAAYYSEESIAFCRRFAASEVVRMLSGGSVHAPVNTPTPRATGVS